MKLETFEIEELEEKLNELNTCRDEFMARIKRLGQEVKAGRVFTTNVATVNELIVTISRAEKGLINLLKRDSGSDE